MLITADTLYEQEMLLSFHFSLILFMSLECSNKMHAKVKEFLQKCFAKCKQEQAKSSDLQLIEFNII